MSRERDRKALKGSSPNKSNMRCSQGTYLKRKLLSLTFATSMKDNILKSSGSFKVCLLRIKTSGKAQFYFQTLFVKRPFHSDLRNIEL